MTLRRTSGSEGEWEAEVSVPPVLAAGEYVVGVALQSPYHVYDDREVLTVHVDPTPDATRESVERHAAPAAGRRLDAPVAPS